MPPPLITAIAVAELPALRRVDRSAPAAAARQRDAKPGGGGVQPRFVLVLPHGDANRLPKNVLPFCYPDLDELARYPFAYENSAEEYTFTLTPKDEPRVYGFCRRYRLGSADTGGRLDLSPYTSVDVKEASQAPSYQCIVILSERCVGARRRGVLRCGWLARRRPAAALPPCPPRRPAHTPCSPSPAPRAPATPPAPLAHPPSPPPSAGRTRAFSASACSCCTRRGWRAAASRRWWRARC